MGRDLARVLPGPFAKHEGWLEGPEHVITWAVGHLVQLAEPEEYDPKFKRWRMADLPIVPDRFKLIVRDERSRKQFTVVKNQLHRDDIDEVVNACDAGREGELIFAYLYEQAKAKKAVRRLWLSSMTQTAIKEAFTRLRPADEMKPLEQAARSRSEADWIVGMNATRAATIRLRSSFDGAVSLGRVQTPTLAIVARREEEIRAFKPEPYWLVEATFAAAGAEPHNPSANGAPAGGERVYAGRYQAPPKKSASKGDAGENGDGAQPTGRGPRIASEREAQRIVEECRDRTGVISKVDRRKQREQPPLLYDLTSLQREANTRFGYSARRTLAAAQRLYEEHKALTYPRTNSRYLSGDMVAEIKPTAELVGKHGEYAKASRYVTSLDLLPLGRVINDAKVTDHHAIIPTRSEHKLDKMGADERRIYDLVTRRFLAVFHPDAELEATRIETTVSGHAFRTSGRVLVVPGWRGVYGELSEEERLKAAAGADALREPGSDGDAAGAGPDGQPRGAEDDDDERPAAAAARRRGRGRADARDREHAQGNQAAATLQRRLAARSDGDRGQARRRRGAARGHEGLRDRHPGDARRDHRAPDRRRLHRARGPRAGGHREGPQRGRAARPPRAHLTRTDRTVGASARQHRAGG